MTITQAEISRSVFGNKRVVIGTYADDDASGNAGVGGAVTTGLITVDALIPIINAASVDSSANAHVVVAGTYPTTSGNVTLVYSNAVTLLYVAIGR